jgi:TRAP-type mannitol/chloroaromatic compound transport system substrate-binding protein
MGPLTRTITAAAVTIALTGAAAAQERFHWTMATSWPSGLPPQLMAEMFAEKVADMSGGRLTIDVQPGGAVVGAFDVLDAVSTGTVEMGHSIASYWIGKHHAAPFFGAIPMTFEGDQYMTWLYEAGGIELWNRLYQDELGLNVVVMPGGINITEYLAWSRRPLRDLEDFQGLRYRTVGWWGEILRGMGVAVTTMPAAELYTSLERGVLDATEFASPWIDRILSFYEVVDYTTGPGMHQPASMMELSINKDAYESLPSDLKAIVDSAAEAVTLRALTMDYHHSMEAHEYFQEHNEFVKVSEEAQHAFRERAWAYLDEQAERDPFFAEVWESVRSYYLRLNGLDEFILPVRARASE